MAKFFQTSVTHYFHRGENLEDRRFSFMVTSTTASIVYTCRKVSGVWSRSNPNWFDTARNHLRWMIYCHFVSPYNYTSSGAPLLMLCDELACFIELAFPSHPPTLGGKVCSPHLLNLSRRGFISVWGSYVSCIRFSFLVMNCNRGGRHRTPVWLDVWYSALLYGALDTLDSSNDSRIGEIVGVSSKSIRFSSICLSGYATITVYVHVFDRK